jgi:hypothetical protein
MSALDAGEWDITEDVNAPTTPDGRSEIAGRGSPRQEGMHAWRR